MGRLFASWTLVLDWVLMVPDQGGVGLVTPSPPVVGMADCGLQGGGTEGKGGHPAAASHQFHQVQSTDIIDHSPLCNLYLCVWAGASQSGSSAV